MVAVPRESPVTMPVAEPIVTIPADPGFHVPPPGSVRVIVEPIHTADGPEIDSGDGFTVTIAVRMQLFGAVYVILAAPPVVPVTTPVDEPTDAKLLVVFHVPPDTLSLNVVVCPGHKFIVPVMTDGSGFTVIVALTLQPAPME